MFFDNQIADLVARGVVLPAIGLAWVVVLIRLNGLRSLSKMTSFDFVMTVAMGSLLAGAAQAASWSACFQIALAMTSLFVCQFVAALLRQRSDSVETAIQNEPVLLMRDGVVLDTALTKNRVTRSDLFAKLREANVLSLNEVRAVVLETTGDVSVLHGDQLDDTLFEGVRLP